MRTKKVEIETSFARAAMQNIKRIVYKSRPTFLECDLRVVDIFKVSLRNNRTEDVRSTLWINQLGLLQVVEGNKKQVESTFKKILNDNRHFDLEVLQSRMITNYILPEDPFDIHFRKNYKAIGSLCQFFSSEGDLLNTRKLSEIENAA